MTHLDQRNFRVYDEHFALVPKNNVPRATFNRSHEFKFTGQAGYLIPILVDEVLPGDVHTGSLQIFSRISNLLFPLMDNAQIDTQFFFVPARILWSNWKKFQGEQANPGDSISYTIPYINFPAGCAENSVYDYMGVPPSSQANQSFNINALPLRAYNLIYNEWYRDQNLQNSLPTQSSNDGPDDPAIFALLQRNKRHDYFTSCLPWPQKTAPITLPLSGTAPIVGLGYSSNVGHAGPKTAYTTGGITATFANYQQVGTVNVENTQNLVIEADGSGFPKIYANLAAATGATINDLRLAVQTQKYLETDARGGTRYTENLRARWGVTPQDARLQRPEYIGGGTSSIQTAAIAQTSATGATGTTTPLGGLAGQATVAGAHHFTCIGHEHGYIIGLLSLMTRPTYQQGLHRLWTRNTRFDFAVPEFVGIGEQAVLGQEIYLTGNDTTDFAVFGYQERYAEYRYSCNRVAGKFRSTQTGTLDTWHLAQRFTSAPTLGDTFIKETAPWARVLAAGAAADNQQFLCDILFTIKSTRPLPAYGIPGGFKGTF